MTTLVLDKEPKVVSVAVKKDKLVVDLADGRSIAVPLRWYPRLLKGKRSERNNCRILGAGYAIEWPDLDEYIGVEGLVAGRRSSESKKSFARWLAHRTKNH